MDFLKRNKSVLPLAIALTLIAAYYLFFLSDIILSPNSYMNSAWNDGIKNYYTFAYHTRYSGVSLHFEGMNFPYGEHVIYTDGMPLFGFLLAWIPFLKGHEVGALNLIMYVSVLIAAIIIWKILIRLKVEGWIAAAGVVGIILLSPQFFRLNGHYALSIMWIIPLIILQLLKLHETSQPLKQSWIISLIIFFLFFIHPYMGLMSLVFAALTALLFFVWRKFDLKTMLISVSILATSAVAFRVFLLLTDTHVNRTDKPSGLFDHFALPETVFVPYFSPFKKILEYFIPITNDQPFEGWGYIGISVILILLSTSVYFVWKMLRRKGGRPSKKIDPVKPIFAAAIIVLLFSMLIPLKWFPEDTIYRLKIFNQFRSVGRFSWVFYYVAGISAVVILQRAYENSKGFKQKLMMGAIFAFPLLSVVETYESFQFFSATLGKQKNIFKRDVLNENQEWKEVLSKIEKEKNAVLFPLPYFYLGTDHSNRDGTSEIQQVAFTMSYHSGIPMMSSMMSRTSVSEAISLFKLLVPGYNGETKIPGFSDKNVLLLTTNQAVDQYEEALIAAAKPLYQGKTVSLYKLNYSSYQSDQISEINRRIKSIVRSNLRHEDFKLSDSAFVEVKDFENEKSEHVFAGSGAWKVKKSAYSILSTIPSQGDCELEASFWYFKGKSGSYSGMVVVEEIDTLTNAGSWIYLTDANRFPIYSREWVLVEVPITMRKGPFKYNLFTVGNEKSIDYFYLDNLLIKTKGIDLYTQSVKWCPNGFESFNNVPFKRKD